MQTMKQRRTAGTLLGVGIAIVIGLFTMWSTVAELFNGPSGYVKHPPTGQYISVNWDELAKGELLRTGKAIVPPEVANLDGKIVRISGFSQPLHHATAGSTLFITPKPGSCYYCSPPSMNGVVEVDMARGRSVELIGDHLYAFGKLKIASSTSDHSLYTLQDAVLMVGQ